jgi:putative phosphoesterase
MNKAARPGRDAPLPAGARVGLISDTHGVLRPEAVAFLRGCSLIIHGGDIGGSQILDELASIAPVTAVRGNNDTEPWAERLRETELIRVGEVRVYVVHDLAKMNTDPSAQGIRVVVSGHSHKPLIDERGGVLFVNPGSAGRRRFKLPIAIGELTIEGASVTARIVTLVDADGTATCQGLGRFAPWRMIETRNSRE